MFHVLIAAVINDMASRCLTDPDREIKLPCIHDQYKMEKRADRSMTSVDVDDLPFLSRRSVVHGRHGMVACSQPLACQAGLDMLKAGGNATEAAITVAACLCVLEPMSTGLGGDIFCLSYGRDQDGARPHCLNGSGASPSTMTLARGRQVAHATLAGSSREIVAYDGPAHLPKTSVHAVTTPGTVRGWETAYRTFGSGRVSFHDLLLPAIRLAEEG